MLVRVQQVHATLSFSLRDRRLRLRRGSSAWGDDVGTADRGIGLTGQKKGGGGGWSRDPRPFRATPQHPPSVYQLRLSTSHSSCFSREHAQSHPHAQYPSAAAQSPKWGPCTAVLSGTVRHYAHVSIVALWLHLSDDVHRSEELVSCTSALSGYHYSSSVIDRCQVSRFPGPPPGSEGSNTILRIGLQVPKHTDTRSSTDHPMLSPGSGAQYWFPSRVLVSHLSPVPLAPPSSTDSPGSKAFPV